MTGCNGCDSKDKSAIEPVNVACVAVEAGLEGGLGSVAGAGCGCSKGLTSQASSSKPADFFVTVGCEVVDRVEVSISPSFFDSSTEPLWNAFGSMVSFVCTGGAGRPFRVLFFKVPPGP
jgi:hypothetical protein